MLKTMRPPYTAHKSIRDPLLVWIFFFTFGVLMGATERPRNTGFRGLSVRSITALQCITYIAI